MIGTGTSVSGNCFFKWIYFIYLFSFKVAFENKYETIQPAFTCSKLTVETLEQGVKHVQS